MVLTGQGKFEPKQEGSYQNIMLDLISVVGHVYRQPAPLREPCAAQAAEQ